MNHKPSQEEENQKWNSSLFYLELEGPPSSLTMLKVIWEVICATCNVTKTETPHGLEKCFQSWHKVGGASPPERIQLNQSLAQNSPLMHGLGKGTTEGGSFSDVLMKTPS